MKVLGSVAYFPLAFLALMLPYVSLGGVQIYVGGLLLVVASVFFILNDEVYVPRASRDLLVIFLLYVSSILMVHILNVYRGYIQPDLWIYKSIIIFSLVFCSACMLGSVLWKRFNERSYLMLFYVGVVNSVVVLLLYVLPGFSDFFYSYIDVNPKVFTYPILRYPGFMYDGFSYLSVYNAFLIFMGLTCYFHGGYGLLSRCAILIAISILLVVIILVGRMGLMLLFWGGVSGVFWCLFSGVRYKGYVKNGFILTIFYALALSLFLSFLSSMGLKHYFTWGVAFIGDFISGDYTSDSTVNELVVNHYFYPERAIDLTVGESDFGTRENGLIKTDVGYVKLIYGGGIFSILAYMSFLVYVIAYAVANRQKRFSFLPFFIATSLIITNSKDFYAFYPAHHYMLLMLIVYFMDQANPLCGEGNENSGAISDIPR